MSVPYCELVAMTYVHDYRSRVVWFAEDRDVAYPSHGCSREEAIVTLATLFSGGEIEFHLLNSDRCLSEWAEVQQRLEEFDLYYGLTATGGARWEAEVHADWGKFINYSGEPQDETHDVVTVRGVSRELIEELLRWQWVGPERRIMIPSVVWRQLGAWEATYWKTLPSGWEVVFRTEEVTDGPAEWHFPGWNRWYRSPWGEKGSA